MQKLAADGWKIVVHTARPWADYLDIETWLKEWNIPFREIVCGKLLAKYYIDDRAIGFSGDWETTLDQIKW